MKKKQKAILIQQILNQYFPSPDIPLNFVNDFTFLVAVILSAQCTDKRVNKITKKLFSIVTTPQEFLQLPISELEDLIRPCGLVNRKSKAILLCAKIIDEKHHGKVPAFFEELEALPGVGHKTASVVLATLFNIPTFPVDTHIHRCAKRWGLSSGKTVVQTEKDLKKLFPKSSWNILHLQIIYFARKYCKAKDHNKKNCPICKEISTTN